MPRFRRKPREVEAERYDGPISVPVGHPRPPAPAGVLWRSSGKMYPAFPIIDSPAGPMTVSPGDWVVTEADGVRYPCQPEDFEAMYEPIEPTKPADAWPEQRARYEASRPSL